MADTDYQAKIGTGRDENRTPLWQVVPIPVQFSSYDVLQCTYSSAFFPNNLMLDEAAEDLLGRIRRKL